MNRVLAAKMSSHPDPRCKKRRQELFSTYSRLRSGLCCAEGETEWMKRKEGAAPFSLHLPPSSFCLRKTGWLLSLLNESAWVWMFDWLSVGMCVCVCICVCSLKLIRENMLSNSFHPQLEIIDSHPGTGSVVPPSRVLHAAEEEAISTVLSVKRSEWHACYKKGWSIQLFQCFVCHI